MKTPELNKLKNRLKVMDVRRHTLRDKIDKMELEKQLPKLKKKYEGRFFKYRNSTGSDTKWWLYSFCKEVVNMNEAIIDSFQVTPYENQFTVNERGFFYLFEVEITEKEYHDALMEFQSRCQLMMDNLVNHTA